MSSPYPVSPDTFVTIETDATLDSMGGELHTELHNRLQSAISALEDTIGYAGSFSFDTAGSAVAALTVAEGYTDSAIAALNLGTASTHDTSFFDLAGAAASALVTAEAFTTLSIAALNLGSLAFVSNLTGPISSVGGTTSITSQTGTGTTFVMAVDPSIVGGTHTQLTSLGIKTTGTGGFDVFLAVAENLNANKVLTFALGNTSRTLTIGASASVSGSNTGDQTTISGNAGSATILATARAINGVNFDGSAAITITAAADTLTGTTLNSTVTASSLTTFGTSPALTGTPTAPTAAGGANTTQIATTAFVTSAVATAVTGTLKFIGSTDCSANPNYPAASKGDVYVVSVAGKIGGASGVAVDVGDQYFALADNAGGTQAAVGSSWDVLEHNLAGALLSANNLSDVASVPSARTNLGATTVGANLFTLADPGAVTFVRLNADNTVTARSASNFRTDLSLNNVTNDAQTKASVVPNTAPAAGRILVGNVGGTAYAPVTVSGSGATITLGFSGVITISAIPNDSLSNRSVTVNGTAIALGASGTLTAAADTLTGTNLNSTVTASSLTSLGVQAVALNMNSHQINNVTDPTAAQDAATKIYVDNAVSAISAKQDCQTATTAALAASTYNNGASGVGATLTLNVAAVLVLDGYTPALNDRLLIKNQAAPAQNGIYKLTTVGTVLVSAVLTRTTDFDRAEEGIDGALVYVLNGTVNANTLWSCTTGTSITFGTTAINWFQFQGTTYTADETTLHLTGTTFSIKSTYPGQSSIVTVGALTGGSTGAGFIVALAIATITGALPAANLTDLSSLTAAEVALADTVPEYNAAATANKKVTVAKVGGFLDPAVFQGRLSLTSGTPVTTSDVTGASTIYLEPFLGNRVAIYDGTRHLEYALTEISLSISALTPGTYDIWVYDNAGTLTLESTQWTAPSTGAITGATNATPIVVTSNAHGLSVDHIVFISGVGGNTAANGTFRLTAVTANTFTLGTLLAANVAGNGNYTSGGTWYRIDAATSRATALTTVDGVYCKNGATTRRFVGTIDIYATGLVNDTDAARNVWNLYNQRARRVYKNISSTHTYGTAAYRAWHNDFAARVQYALGLQLDSVALSIFGSITPGTAGTTGAVGIGFSSVSSAELAPVNATANEVDTGGPVETYGTLGRNYASALQYASATTTYSNFYIYGHVMG